MAYAQNGKLKGTLWSATQDPVTSHWLWCIVCSPVRGLLHGELWCFAWYLRINNNLEENGNDHVKLLGEEIANRTLFWWLGVGSYILLHVLNFAATKTLIHKSKLLGLSVDESRIMDALISGYSLPFVVRKYNTEEDIHTWGSHLHREAKCGDKWCKALLVWISFPDQP